ncbi:MAG: Na+/H+ antiporter subunit E [Firmicutes bacterium]|nr:Na+/H+ antiporter subunit E [Bacillota bacterium]
MFVFWFSLSGQLHPLLLILGVISSLLVAYWSTDVLIGQMNKGPDIDRIFRMIAYVPWLVWQIVLSNIHVVQLVLSPKLEIDPKIIRFKHDLKTDMGIVILANSITLTPGTITINGGRGEFIVHAVSKKTADDLLSGEMQAKVKGLEGVTKEAETANA